MPDRSQMSGHRIWTDLPSATSLLGLEAGHTRSSLRDGQKIEKSGPDRAHASPSVPQDPAQGSLILDTSGQPGTSLSPSDVLQLSLASRLRELMTGSPLCEVIWRSWNTPWQRCLSRPRALVRRTSGTDTGLLPTPTAQSYGSNQGGAAGRTGPVRHSLESMARNGMWPTPTGSLGDHAGLVTPDKAREGGTLVEAVSARMWPTPTVGDSRNSRNATAGRKPENDRHHSGTTLSDAIKMWPTPASRDYRHPGKHSYEERGGGKKGEQLPFVAGGPLNPAWVAALMGYPPEWTRCAPGKVIGKRASRERPTASPDESDS
jgi:hypothetical protein